jgi:hypothetical protein
MFLIKNFGVRKLDFNFLRKIIWLNQNKKQHANLGGITDLKLFWDESNFCKKFLKYDMIKY